MPIVSTQTVVLVLGSFPSERSLAEGRYYAHPQNHFWKILQALWPAHPLPPGTASAERADWLTQRGLGLWDVYGSCQREGSLDTSIRDAALNDFATLDVPRLAAIAHNGAESFRHAPQVIDALRDSGHGVLPAYKLPSTSPAHAAMSFDRKCEAWHDVFARHGLVA
ncbi:DNA-deoxyinosine glycosylase [Variovorax sp. LT2P21]|uniref:DNA-deoxyinosine glycosylase n=1 Tax=Variovorax sp. LT2P21 TaxID=3443731 RepID=UPI003F45FB6E